MHELLTHEQEIELAKRIERGDQLARERLALANQGLVALYARRWTKSLGVTVEEAMQIANIGLMRAVDAYDWREGVRFGSYAGIWIKQALSEWHIYKSPMIRLSANLHEVQRQILEACERLKERGITPSVEQVVIESGVPLSKVRRYLEAASCVQSLDHKPRDNERGQSLGDTLSSDYNLEEVVEHRATLQELARALNLLSERERGIIVERYGLNNNPRRTLGEIGDRLGVSRQRVAELERRALAKLKEQLKVV